MFHRFRHSLASAREVVWPLVLGAGPYLVACAAIGGIAWYIWKGGGSGDSVPGANTPIVAVTHGFEKAVALAESGDLEGARVRMRALAQSGGGDVRAHWWLAQDWLTQAQNSPGVGQEISEAALVQVKTHLEEVVQRDPENSEAPPILAQTYVLLGEVQKAYSFLEAKATKSPEFHLLAADLAGSFGNQRERQRHAIAAATHFQRVCENAELDAKVRVAARHKWARAEIAIGNFERAREILRKRGFEGPATDSDTQESWNAVLVQSWLGPILKALSSGEDTEILKLLDRAAEELGPCRELVDVGGAVAARAAEALRPELSRFYERMAASDTNDVPLEVALGSMALALKRTGEGLAHLERAIALEPDHTVALNNLGYGLAFLAEPPQLDRAMEMLDRAIAAGLGSANKIPPNCWETRGQILAKLERWEEAAMDLERALYAMPSHEGVHRTLSTVYREIGQTDLADAHAKLADGRDQ